MSISNIKWLRRLLLTSIYALGVLGTVGSSGGGGLGGDEIDFDCDDFGYPLAGCDDPPPPPPPGPSGTYMFDSRVNTIAPALDSSDDVYVGGWFGTYNSVVAYRIARLNNDGSLDTGFVTGDGFTSTSFTSRVNVISPAIDGSADVYIGGSFTGYNGTPAGRIARLNLDGTLDTLFDTGTGFDNGVSHVAPAVDGSGDVYVSGAFTNFNGTAVGSGLIRLNDEGSIDAGFGTGSGWGGGGVAPVTDGSGDVYAAKSTSPGIVRLNDDGSIDTEFDTGLSGFNGDVRAIAVATDGSGDIYAAGFFTEYNGTGTNGLARLNSDGSLDSGFVTDAGYVGWGNFIAPAIDGSGDIYVDSNIVGAIVRLNGDGSLDAGFASGEFNASPTSVALATDGSSDIYVGGDFTFYQFSPAGRMARLTAGGAFVR